MRLILTALFIPSICFAWKRASEPPAAPAEKKPDWISGASASYPKSDYIIGIGESSTQEKAADKARAEAAKAFGISVSARTEISAEETSGGSRSSSTERLSDDVRTATAKVMDGVEIAQYWQDSSGAFHALAVLNREHSLHILKDKLEEFDRDFKDLSSGLAKSEGKFSRLKYGLKLVQLAKSRKKVNSDYRVLNPEGRGIAPPEELNDVVSNARKALSALKIQVSAAGDGADSISLRVVDDLETLGLRVETKSENTPDILIELKCAGAALPPENLLWFWAKGEIQGKLSYGPAGEIFDRFDEAGQESTRSPETALDLTMRGLADKAALRSYHAILTANLADD